MSRRSPFEVRLSVEDRAVLRERASSLTAAHAVVVRARIVLLAADGEQNVDIARRVGVCVDVASKWRKRFCEERLAGLNDRPRAGRPRRFGSAVVAGIKAMACEPPEQRQVPLSRWSSFELAAQAVSEGLVESISSSTVRRWLHTAAIKPWRHRSWIFPRDPNQGAVSEVSGVSDRAGCTLIDGPANSVVCPVRFRRMLPSWTKSRSDLLLA